MEKVKLVDRADQVEEALFQQVLLDHVRVAVELRVRVILVERLTAHMAEPGAHRLALLVGLGQEPQAEMALTAQQIILQNLALLF